MAVPVFSLRTANSGGIGEFLDIMPLVDWATRTGMKVIQVGLFLCICVGVGV